MTLLAPRSTDLYGCTFRSRLEAKWAVFFTFAEIPWLYEPRPFALPDGRGYLPDFLLWGSVWCEVKPFLQTSDKAQALACANPELCVVLLNGPPDYHMDIRLGRQPRWTGLAPSLGQFVDHQPVRAPWERPTWHGLPGSDEHCLLYAKARGCAAIAEFKRGKAYISPSFLDRFQ